VTTRRVFRSLSSFVLVLSALVGVGVHGVTPAAAAGASAVAIGARHACAITEKGEPLCWGANFAGQVGDGTTVKRLHPTPVIGLPPGVEQLSAYGDHSCAVTDAGSLLCWGSNRNGELGTGDTDGSTVPMQVSGLSSGVAQVSTGTHSTCAVIAGGAECWGGNGHGQLGDGSTTRHLLPTDVSGLTSGVASIATSSSHTCAVTDLGGARCWGNNLYGELGDGTTHTRLLPIDVSGLSTGVASLDLGAYHTCALTDAGGVKCWGLNSFGQLGGGTIHDKYRPVDVWGLTSGVVALSVGGNHACAITDAGALLCWGDNAFGDLGDGTRSQRSKPTPVVGMSSGVAAVSAGALSTCAIKVGGAVYCWGGNHGSELGVGLTRQAVKLPTLVERLRAGS
jgi:alpha-tubulin suppressor-like RCC1 family protein